MLVEIDYSLITELNLKCKNLNELPDLSKYINLQSLKYNNNYITLLDNLPQTLETLVIMDNKITSLDNLPALLQRLQCSNNKITSLDNLPQSLKELYCNINKINSLDNLPKSLKILCCFENNLITLDNLPKTLDELVCYDNNINITLYNFINNNTNKLKHIPIICIINIDLIKKIGEKTIVFGKKNIYLIITFI